MRLASDFFLDGDMLLVWLRVAAKTVLALR